MSISLPRKYYTLDELAEVKNLKLFTEEFYRAFMQQAVLSYEKSYVLGHREVVAPLIEASLELSIFIPQYKEFAEKMQNKTIY